MRVFVSGSAMREDRVSDVNAEAFRHDVAFGFEYHNTLSAAVSVAAHRAQKSVDHDSGLGYRVYGTQKEQAILGDWPLPRPRQWRRLVNQPQTEAELKALRRCVHRNQPYGSDHWVKRMAVSLGLESTLRPRGRPKKE